MEPILSKLEKKNASDRISAINPVDEITSLDKIYKSTLLQPNIIVEVGTKETRVQRETTDDE